MNHGRENPCKRLGEKKPADGSGGFGCFIKKAIFGIARIAGKNHFARGIAVLKAIARKETFSLTFYPRGCDHV